MHVALCVAILQLNGVTKGWLEQTQTECIRLSEIALMPKSAYNVGVRQISMRAGSCNQSTICITKITIHVNAE
jgi:hypothetical protein